MSARKEWGNGPNQCDHGHDTAGEVRRLETGGGSGVIVCQRHHAAEIAFRRERNAAGVWSPFLLPEWESLPVYDPRAAGEVNS